MAATTANTLPLWIGRVRNENIVITTASAAVNSQAPGTIGTDCFLLHQETNADGGYLQKIKFAFVSTTGAINVVATNLNIFISTISTGATSSANTFLYHTLQVPAQTISGPTVAPIFYEVPMNLGIPQGKNILVAQTVAANANSAWEAHCICGGY